MKEYFNNLVFNDYNEVQLQLVFFVTAFNCLTELRSLWQSLIVLIAFLWMDGKILDTWPIVASLVGLALALLTIKIANGQEATRNNVVKIIYALIQPILFFYLAPCYVDQTEFPVGIILAFIAWFCLFLIVTGSDGERHWLFYVPIITMFFFSVVLFTHPGLPLILTASLQMATLGFVLQRSLK